MQYFVKQVVICIGKYTIQVVNIAIFVCNLIKGIPENVAGKGLRVRKQTKVNVSENVIVLKISAIRLKFFKVKRKKLYSLEKKSHLIEA